MVFGGWIGTGSGGKRGREKEKEKGGQRDEICIRFFQRCSKRALNYGALSTGLCIMASLAD